MSYHVDSVSSPKLAVLTRATCLITKICLAFSYSFFCTVIISSSGWPGRFSPLPLEMGLGHGSGSELPGEYGYVFVLKSGFTGHMCLSESNHAMAIYSPISCVVHVYPISGVACVKTPCEATNRVSQIIFSLMVLKYI